MEFRMTVEAAGAIWQREFIRYWRDKTRIISTMVQPLMFLAIFGTGLKSSLARGDFGLDFVQFMYPGIIAMSIMSVSFFSTISTVWDREFGFLKEILVAPISRVSITLGKILGAVTIASIQGFLLLVLAPVLKIRLHPLTFPYLLLFMIMVAFSLASLGLLIASLMKTTESFGLVMQLLIFPMFFVSGAFFPLTSVPRWMKWLAAVNPLTYGVDALRQILLFRQTPAEALYQVSLHPVSVDALFLLVFSVVIISLAALAFNKKN
ncbi:MAG: ABC transporter permease [Candidatus Saccharicenans sp.]|jgi:ABC-2 type transport system permease protein|nr:ABC transporter permease [Candidatus Saccharicenans sp.]MDH7493321.1 ABC transporter permease [Candidatus Saccharicenans sp.]